MNLISTSRDIMEIFQGYPDWNHRLEMKICSECSGRTCISTVYEDMGECPGEICLPICPFKESHVTPNWLTLVRMQNTRLPEDLEAEVEDEDD